MQQKIFFIADYLRQTSSLTDLCTQYSISRKTGYKWIQRFESIGIDGLSEQSRRPKSSPVQTPYRLQQSIIELRQKFQIMPGAKKIQVLLAQQYPHETIPSKSTIYNILNRAGLIQSRRRKRRVSPYPQPFSPVSDVNECWSVDYKGQFKLGNGQWCYPLTIMDHKSRYLLACDALNGPRLKETKAVFTRLFKDRGMPQRLRSDNGVPFASIACGGLSQLSIWWIKLGIQPERIEPGKPQQNGRHERMHRTLKKATTRPPSQTIKKQQTRFNSFCQEYNEVRPHEALQQRTPASLYTASTREYPNKLPLVQYPDYYEIKKVASNGVVYWRNKIVYVSQLLHNEMIGMEEIDDGIWHVYFSNVMIGQFNERNMSKTQPYLSIKV